jgi:hypothetical protein
MQDRPTLTELIDAVRGFIERDVVTALDGTPKFHARVAANVLAIVARELALPPPAALRDALLQRSEALCARIRAGDADGGPFRAATLAHVRATVREKLIVANPKLLSPPSPDVADA